MAYNVLRPVHLIAAGDMSGSITSNAVEVRNQDNVGIQLNWTGTPTGTFAFQVSNDHVEDIDGNILVAGNWITLPVMPAIAAAGSSDTAYVDLNQLSSMYMRIMYSRVSGTGVLDVFVTAKGI